MIKPNGVVSNGPIIKQVKKVAINPPISIEVLKAILKNQLTAKPSSTPRGGIRLIADGTIPAGIL